MSGSEGPSLTMAVLELLFSRAHKLVVVGLVVFFMGPTLLVGFLVWRLVEREDHAITQIVGVLSEHSIQSQEHINGLQTLMGGFIATQHDLENQRNALLFEMCISIANDGPGRSRCRQAIGR